MCERSVATDKKDADWRNNNNNNNNERKHKCRVECRVFKLLVNGFFFFLVGTEEVYGRRRSSRRFLV